MNRIARWLMILGVAAFFVGPGIGILIGASAVYHLQATMGPDAAPEKLAKAMSGPLTWTFAGLGLGVMGATALAIGLLLWWINRRASAKAIPAP